MTSFWRENHLCTLTTLRPDGTPHVVPVGVTYEPEEGVARIITNKGSRKIAHILAAGPEGARVASAFDLAGGDFEQVPVCGGESEAAQLAVLRLVGAQSRARPISSSTMPSST